jgi:hypothetical protein
VVRVKHVCIPNLDIDTLLSGCLDVWTYEKATNLAFALPPSIEIVYFIFHYVYVKVVALFQCVLKFPQEDNFIRLTANRILSVILLVLYSRTLRTYPGPS